MRVCTSKPALRFTRLREASRAAAAGLKIQTSSDRNTGKGRQPGPTPRARARCPSHGANAVRSMQTGARRIVQKIEVLISHLHKRKRVSKLELGDKQHAMRRKRGTVLLFRDEIDRSDSVFGNATPRAVLQVPAVSGWATSRHACRQLAWISISQIERAYFLKNLRSCVCEPKICGGQDSWGPKKCEPDLTGQDS